MTTVLDVAGLIMLSVAAFLVASPLGFGFVGGGLLVLSFKMSRSVKPVKHSHPSDGGLR